MPTITDGAYFELDGTTFSVVTMKDSTETRVSSGAFNGQLGASYSPTTNNTIWEIVIQNGGVVFVIGGIPLHKVTAASGTWANTTNFYIWMDAGNSGNSSAVAMYCRTANISRVGALHTQPTSFYQAGQIAEKVLKYGPGNILGLAISGVVNNAVVTLYDNTAASGTILFSTGSMGANTVPFSIDLFGVSFSIGLTLSITTANANATVAYE
jgi:hypothetical protein